MAADPPKSVRIGYAISLSGQNAQGAAITTLSGYKLWVDDVNKKGGLKVQGFDKRIPIEVTEYDDTSNAETLVRLTERLMTQDKVDFVLPPWSTGFNLAAAPIYARNGYPQLAVTANSNDAANLVKQMPTLFFFLNEPRNFGAALVEVLGKLKTENKINNKIVMFSVADQFGAEAPPASRRCCRRPASRSSCARAIRSAPPTSPTRSRKPRPRAPTPSWPTAIRPTPSC